MDQTAASEEKTCSHKWTVDAIDLVSHLIPKGLIVVVVIRNCDFSYGANGAQTCRYEKHCCKSFYCSSHGISFFPLLSFPAHRKCGVSALVLLTVPLLRLARTTNH